MSIAEEVFRQHALSFDEAVEQPHFDKMSFRVANKIFATLEPAKQRASVRLSEIDQSVFCQLAQVMHPANGTWGQQGWTIIELRHIEEEMLLDALTCSYCNAAPAKLASKYRRD